jgi:co-chaperonin GroES (HSP10)
MKLLGNRILAERIKRPMNPGGLIHMPEVLHDDDNTGGPKEWRVLEVGPGRKLKDGTPVPIECAPGDRVICHSYTRGATEAAPGKFILDAEMIIAVLPLK